MLSARRTCARMICLLLVARAVVMVQAFTTILTAPLVIRQLRPSLLVIPTKTTTTAAPSTQPVSTDGGWVLNHERSSRLFSSVPNSNNDDEASQEVEELPVIKVCFAGDEDMVILYLGEGSEVKVALADDYTRHAFISFSVLTASGDTPKIPIYGSLAECNGGILTMKDKTRYRVQVCDEQGKTELQYYGVRSTCTRYPSHP